ncbi:hypothetical protein AB205_0178700, partial [Aquarana catesbeiana]
MSLERGRTTAYCQVISSGNDEDGGDRDDGDVDDEVTDVTWVPDRAEEETEGEAAQPQGGQQQERVESSHPIPSHSAAVISRPTPQSSAVWAFFSTSAADRTVAICKLCLRYIKRDKNTNHLGTTCLTRHLMSNHSARWQEHLIATQKGYKYVPPPYPLQSAPAIPSHYLSKASTDRDDGIAQRVPGPSSTIISSKPAVDCIRQISLPHLLQQRKKKGPCHPHAQHLNASLSKLLTLQLLLSAWWILPP